MTKINGKSNQFWKKKIRESNFNSSNLYSKILFCLWMTGICVLPLFGQSFMQNSDFKIKKRGTNIPAGWITGAKVEDAGNGVISVSNPKGGITMIYNTRVTPGIPIDISTEIKAEKDTYVRVYLEWITQGGDYINSGAGFVHVTNKNWTVIKNPRVVVVGKGYKKCYLVINSKYGKKFYIRKPSIKISKNKQIQVMGGKINLKSPIKQSGKWFRVKGKTIPLKIRDIPVSPGEKYRISYTAEGFSDPIRPTPFQAIRTTIRPSVEGSFAFNDVPNSAQRKFQIFRVPKNSGTKKIEFGLYVTGTGTVAFKDFTIEKIVEKRSDFWEFSLTKPFYRDSFFSGEDSGSIEGNIKAKGADTAKLILLNGDSQIASTTIPIKNGKASFNLPVNLSEGRYKLTCRLIVEGKTEKEFSKIILKLAKAANQVTIGKNRYPLINGKPFFPILQWQIVKGNDNFYYYAARQGVNLTLLDPWGMTESKILSLMDIAHKYGIMCVFNMRGVGKIETLRGKFTESIRNHPALFGYHVLDEPLWHGISDSYAKAGCDALKELDPYHPTWINVAPRNAIADLKPYAAICDIFGVDIYPIPYPNSHSGISDKYPTACGKYSRRMNETAGFDKPIFTVLQAFAWHEVSGGSPKPHPSLTESRFMAYDSLLNGANGYVFWGTPYMLKASFFGTLFSVTNEMRLVSTLFLNGRQLADGKSSNPKVRCAIMKSAAGNKYYFILNLSPKPQKAKTNAKGKIIFGNGGTIKNGVAKLNPYEVLLCSKKSLPPVLRPLPDKNEKLEADGNPFVKNSNEKLDFLKNPVYSGNANWIWFKKGQFMLAKCFAYKAFDLPDGTTSAKLRIAVDNFHTVYLNGNKIGSGESFTHMYEYKLDKFLRAGKNEIVIYAEDEANGLCGILAEIVAPGKTVITDKSWKVIPMRSGPPPSSAEFMNAKNAVIVAPFGSGRWGRNVRIVQD